MNPIFEQRSGRGIGHGVDSFLARFDEICSSQSASSRAQAFAFILYDFRDAELRKLLKDQGVFARLDRLSGSTLSLFYLHSGPPALVRKFNSFVREKLGLGDKLRLPCVAFFRLSANVVTDPLVVQLDQADLVHGFHELYSVVERYLNNLPPPETSHIHVLKGSAPTLGINILRAGLKSALDQLLP